MVPVDKSEKYLRLSPEIGLAGNRATEGNRGARHLHRRDGDVVYIEIFTPWDDEDAIHRLAGPDMLEAHYNIFD
jgi:hypothetical protein